MYGSVYIDICIYEIMYNVFVFWYIFVWVFLRMDSFVYKDLYMCTCTYVGI